MRQLIPDLTQAWPNDLVRPFQGPAYQLPAPQFDPSSDEIVHEYFWHRLPDFIPENSIVVAETGTSEFGKTIASEDVCTVTDLQSLLFLGIFNMRSPRGVTFETQILWGSIGYSVGAGLGASLAGKAENRRVFILVGDGSFQVSFPSARL